MIPFVAGAICGAAIMLAIVAARRPEWELTAAVEAKQRMRQSCGWVLVELTAELTSLSKHELRSAYPHHAPMRYAYGVGYTQAMSEAARLVRDAHKLVTQRDEAQRPLHPSETAPVPSRGMGY